MTGLLLDTHIWLWHLVGSKRLPRAVADRIAEEPGKLWLSPISLWEAAMLARKGRIRLDRSFLEWQALAFERLPLREASLGFEVVRRGEEIDTGHPDPADRLLAATALTYELMLVTVDRRLKRLRWLPTWPR